MAVKDQEYLADSFFTSPPAYDDDDDSTMSNGSSSSSSSSSTDNTTDDAISPPSLYDFSELMDQLPIKRGLSMFYKGKSESFMSLSKVSSLDDLKKKEIPHSRRRRRSCRTTKNSSRSYLPNPTTKFKKTPRASSSFSSSSFQSKRVSFVCRRNTPPKMTSLLKE